MVKKKEKDIRKLEVKEHVLKHKEIYAKKLKELVEENEREQKEYQSKLSKLESDLVDKKHIIQCLTQDLKKVEIQKESKLASVSDLKRKKATLLDEVNQFEKEIAETTKSIKLADEEEVKLQGEISTLKQQKEEKEILVEELANKKNQVLSVVDKQKEVLALANHDFTTIAQRKSVLAEELVDLKNKEASFLEEIKKLEKEITETSQSIELATEEEVKLKDRISELQNINEKKLAAISELTKKKDQVLNLVNKYKESLESLNKGFESSAEKEAVLNEEISSLNKEKLELEAKIKEYDVLAPLSKKGLLEEVESLKTLESSVEALRTELKEKESGIINLVEENNRISNETLKVTSQLREFTLEKINLDKQEANIRSQMTNSLESHKSLVTQRDKIKKASKEAGDRISRSLELVSRADEKLKSDRENLSVLMSEYKNLKDHEISLRSEIATKKSEILKNTKDIESYKEDISSMTVSLSGSKKTLIEVSEELSKLLKEVKFLSQEKSDLQKNCSSTKEKLIKETEELKITSEERTSLEKEISLLNSQLKSNKKGISLTEKNLEKETKLVDSLKSDLKALKSENKILESRLDSLQDQYHKVNEERKDLDLQRKEQQTLKRTLERNQNKLKADIELFLTKMKDLSRDDAQVSFKELKSYVHGVVDLNERAVDLIGKSPKANELLKTLFRVIISEKIYCKSLTLQAVSNQVCKLVIKDPFDSVESCSDVLSQYGVSNLAIRGNDLEILININGLEKQQNFPL